jgi:hypothetical protein
MLCRSNRLIPVPDDSLFMELQYRHVVSHSSTSKSVTGVSRGITQEACLDDALHYKLLDELSLGTRIVTSLTCQ